ncbi:unnamed protein product [Schistocephalus solidus]|uniref:Sodium/solute symporter n=1 Tax=Schistocephalus solidus TaxID=70667 RepID=A0A183T0F3_SCHSO|nr:unnamed protein product [Schistocephalus solidus]
MERYEVFGIFFSYAIVMFTLLLVIFAVRKYILKQDLQREKFTPVINLGAFTFALISQMTWVSTLFQSSSMGVQFGISGPVWYAVTGICPSAIFCILFTQFRKKAPGARTYLQVIYARFGKAAHYTVCTFALLNNFSVMAIVIANGSKVFAAIDDQISFELVWIITVIVAGICASIGNVRQVIPTCICVSIFLFTVTMAITMDIFFTSSNSLLVTFAQVVMDQANWEICSVAPPGMASAGILAACFLWLTLPFAFGTATSLGYFALRKDPFENASFTIDTAEFFPAATPRATAMIGRLKQVRASGVVCASTPGMSDSEMPTSPLSKSPTETRQQPRSANEVGAGYTFFWSGRPKAERRDADRWVPATPSSGADDERKSDLTLVSPLPSGTTFGTSSLSAAAYQ